MVLKNTNFSVLVDFVKLLVAEQSATRSELFVLTTNKLSKYVVRGTSVSSQKILKLLERSIREPQKENLISMFAIEDRPVLREADAKQVRRILRAMTVVQTYAASNKQVQECLVCLLR